MKDISIEIEAICDQQKKDFNEFFIYNYKNLLDIFRRHSKNTLNACHIY